MRNSIYIRNRSRTTLQVLVFSIFLLLAFVPFVAEADEGSVLKPISWSEFFGKRQPPIRQNDSWRALRQKTDGDDDALFLGQSGSLGYQLTNCYLPAQQVYGHSVLNPSQAVRGVWHWQTLPSGVLYRNSLAGANQSRMASVWHYEEDKKGLWSVTLGAKIPVLRYGPRNTYYPEGFQVDVEGSTRLRVDLDDNLAVDTSDFRFGIPLSYGNEMLQVKTGYYHVSSSLTNMLVVIDGQPIEYKGEHYTRDAWILGISCQLPQSIRLYAEADYAFRGKKMKPWHFQFGAEYTSMDSTSVWGHPFAAVNVHLMEEHDFDGNYCVQVGWQWRGQHSQLFRIGLQYQGGISDQFEYIGTGREHKFGLGMWYDF